MAGGWTNQMHLGDNLRVLRQHVPDESVDLVYLDPPFNSGASYRVLFRDQDGPQLAAHVDAFEDYWHWDQAAEETCHELVTAAPTPVGRLIRALREVLGSNDMMAYLAMMAARLVELHRVLKPTGSIYLHCDPTASHTLKLVMDAVFGPGNYRNEIIWRYRTGGASRRHFARKHDVLLFYTRSNTYTFHLPLEKAYTRSKSRKPGVINYGAGSAEFFEDEQGVYNWVHMADVWDIPYINSQAKERLGYPTQKPEALLERILEASSNEGDLVLDPFCGCGTTLAVAERLGRRWIGIDTAEIAITLSRNRLRDAFGPSLSAYTAHGQPSNVGKAVARGGTTEQDEAGDNLT